MKALKESSQRGKIKGSYLTAFIHTLETKKFVCGIDFQSHMGIVLGERSKKDSGKHSTLEIRAGKVFSDK